MNTRQIMSAEEIQRALVRIGHEIVEKHGGTTGLALVGIERRGPILAQRIADTIQARCGCHASGRSPGRDALSR